MIRPWIIWPIISLLAVFLSGEAWESKKLEWSAPEAKRPNVPEVVEPLTTAFTVQASEARERPVMWSSRRVKKVVAKDTRQLDEFMQSRLLSVLESGTVLIATLRRKDGGLTRVARDSTPWRIQSFDGRTAVFSGPDGQSVNLILEAGRSR